MREALRELARAALLRPILTLFGLSEESLYLEDE